MPNRSGGLRGLIAVAVLAAAAAAVWFGPASAAGQEASQAPGTPEDRGALLYQQNCTTCHGSEGQGGPAGPTLRGVGPASVDFYLRTGRMPLGQSDSPGFRQEPAFIDPDVVALVEYTRQWSQGGPEIPNVVTDGADLRRGAELYLQNCASCHAATGAGDAVGGGQWAPPLNKAAPPQIAEAVLIGPGAMPAFPFLEGDLNHIVAYVEFLRSGGDPGGIDIGRQGPVSEGFIALFVGLGLLVVIARWVAREDPR